MLFFPCNDACHGIRSCILRASEKHELTNILDGFVQSGCELVIRVSLWGDSLDENTGPELELRNCLVEEVDLVGVSVKLSRALLY